MTHSQAKGISGLRVLVADDELFCAMELEELLRQLDCNVVGPVACVSEVLALVEEIDCALLDVNLRGEKSYGAASQLQDEGIPFAFVTGYSELPACPPTLIDTPKLSKPCNKAELAGILVEIFKPRQQRIERGLNGAFG